MCSGAPLQVVVASSALLGGGADEVERLRTVIGRPELPWVLLDEGEDDPLLAGAQGANGIAAMGEDSPTENVLFLTNELLAGAQTSARGSRRLLFNGLCAFRTGRTLAYRHASLYNISRTGLYVRTLVPLPKGETVHLEMALPEGECLHLSGVVAWSRGAADGGQLAPPGFGVQLLASQCAPTELDAYVRAYEVLAARHQASARRRSGARRNAVEITTDVPDAHSA